MIHENFELLEEDYENNQLIRLTSEKYSGIIYSYGRVNLIEEDDQLRIQFEYDIHENPIGILNETDFRNTIGDILVDLMDQQLLNNQIVYTGGIDEN